MINKIILSTVFFICSINSMEPTEKMEYMKNGFKYAKQLGFTGNPDARYEFMKKGGNFKDALSKQNMSKINVTVNQLPSVKESPLTSPVTSPKRPIGVNKKESVNQSTPQPITPSPVSTNTPVSPIINLQSQIDDMQNKIKNLNEIITTYQQKELEALTSQYETMNQQAENCFEIDDEENDETIKGDEEINEMLTNAIRQETNDTRALSTSSAPPLKLNPKRNNQILKRSTSNVITLHPISMHFGTGNIMVHNKYKNAKKETKNALQ